MLGRPRMAQGGHDRTESRKRRSVLIVCPDCRARVSELAQACPRCGRPISARRTSNEESDRRIFAALASFIFPGVGHLIQGRRWGALACMLGFLLVPGVVWFVLSTLRPPEQWLILGVGLSVLAVETVAALDAARWRGRAEQRE